MHYNFGSKPVLKRAPKRGVPGPLTNVSTLVRDDEVAAELGRSVLNDEFQLGFAFVLDALEIQRRREALQHLAHGGLQRTSGGNLLSKHKPASGRGALGNGKERGREETARNTPRQC